MKADNTIIQMRKGILEYCILRIISRDEIYASDLIEELKAAEIIVVEGTLYPLLNRLSKAELLTYTWKESSSGPPRKYYTLTKAGLKVLNKLEETWQSLVQSIEKISNKNPEPKEEVSLGSALEMLEEENKDDKDHETKTTKTDTETTNPESNE